MLSIQKNSLGKCLESKHIISQSLRRDPDLYEVARDHGAAFDDTIAKRRQESFSKAVNEARKRRKLEEQMGKVSRPKRFCFGEESELSELDEDEVQLQRGLAVSRAIMRSTTLSSNVTPGASTSSSTPSSAPTVADPLQHLLDKTRLPPRILRLFDDLGTPLATRARVEAILLGGAAFGNWELHLRALDFTTDQITSIIVYWGRRNAAPVAESKGWTNNNIFQSGSNRDGEGKGKGKGKACQA